MKTTIALILIGIIFLTLSVTSALATTEHCPAGYEKKDEHFPFSYTTTVGKRINKICIKSSTSVFEFLTNGSNGCYLRSGIGSQTASAFKVGFGSSCKDISHVAFYTEVIPTPVPPTPEPTVEPSPSPSPTIEPSPQPTPVPETSPVPTPEPPCGVECQPVLVAKSVPSPNFCKDAVPGEVANIFVDRGEPNDGKLEVRWLNKEPHEGAKHAHILYTDTVPGDWKYALLNTPNDGIEVIGELKNGVHYWFAVMLVNGCQPGAISAAFDPIP